jgi:hypothetical protein
MAAREDTLRLFREGLNPREISNARGVSIRTTLPYLNELVGRGLIRRSDIFFSISFETRQSIADEFRRSGVQPTAFIDGLRRKREIDRADDAEASVDSSKPATDRHFKTGHHGRSGRDQ